MNTLVAALLLLLAVLGHGAIVVPDTILVERPAAEPETVEYTPTPVECTNCQNFLKILSKTGCQMACDVLMPDMRPICHKILNKSNCAEIMQWLSQEGLSPHRICESVGLCPKAIEE